MEIDKRLLDEIVKGLEYYIEKVGEAELWKPASSRNTSEVLNDLKAAMNE